MCSALIGAHHRCLRHLCLERQYGVTVFTSAASATLGSLQVLLELLRGSIFLNHCLQRILVFLVRRWQLCTMVTSAGVENGRSFVTAVRRLTILPEASNRSALRS